MYETHFGFHRQPFQSADASRAFFDSESIREILPQLLHALRSDLGIAVLTGVPGSGKTTLLRHVQQQLSNEGRAIVCSGANLGASIDLIGVLLQASQMKGGESSTKAIRVGNTPQGSRSSALDQIKRTAELWGPILLLIDDVQLVPLPVLNELRACTEEEWNGRDLVRCLVSAPISFEDQLARPEYAEFARRIRCHAFLQPLKSRESMLFLKDQIELAGGQLSKVFTTPALESITAAAAGIPRCLGLLADETLVVAATTGEIIASEQAVRTALGRLQHLQYNWNASPHTNAVHQALPEDESMNIESSPPQVETTHPSAPPKLSSQATVSSVGTPAMSRFRSATQATLSPGVIEFGGPATPVPRSTTAETLLIPPPIAVQETSKTDHSTIDIVVTEFIESKDRVFQNTHTVEIVSTETTLDLAQSLSNVDTFPAVQAEKPIGNTQGFEVGRRFVSEAAQESISIEDVEDCDILDLLNSDCGLDFKNVSHNSLQLPSVTKCEEVAEAKIVWFNGNGDDLATQLLADTGGTDASFEDNLTSINDAAVLSEPTISHTVGTGQNAQSEASEHEAIKPALATGFFNPSRENLSNRTPVFDRYTWLALGREVPPGRSSVVSMSAAKQLIKAEYAMAPLGQRTSIALLAATSQRATSIDQIPIIATTDAALIGEISQFSSNAQSGTYMAISGDNEFAAEILQVPDRVADHAIVISRFAVDETDVRTLHDDADMQDSATTISNSKPGLRIWQDGMLVYLKSDHTDNVDELKTVVLRVETNAGELETTGLKKDSTSHELLSVDNNLLTLGAGGFFTLPALNTNHNNDLNSLGIADHDDVYTFVEAINNMRADVRSFQDTGSVPVGDSETGTRNATNAIDSANTADNVIARAKMWVDQRANTGDTQIRVRQAVPEVRSLQKVQMDIPSDPLSDETTISDSIPKFSQLFTRLRETRKRAADQATADT